MVNRRREETLGLPALFLLASELELRGESVPRLYPCNPRVVPADWDAQSTTTGYWFLDQGVGWQPPAELTEFLEGGPPPVFVGFGSAARDPEGSRAAVLAVLERPGLRGVLATGRSGTGSPGIIEGAPRLVVPADGRRGALRRGRHHRRGVARRQADGCLPV
jgi:hypothetical protein